MKNDDFFKTMDDAFVYGKKGRVAARVRVDLSDFIDSFKESIGASQAVENALMLMKEAFDNDISFEKAMELIREEAHKRNRDDFGK